jgi:hypothetical protein
MASFSNFTIPTDASMLIEENALKHWIDNFYGYGSWDSRFWFIGYEESGGELPEEVAEKINYLYKIHPPTGSKALCDIRDLYKNVAMHWDGPKAGMFNDRYEYRFGNKAIQHGVWKNLISFVHGYQSEKLPDQLEYQKNIFASSTLRNEALIQLYPLPSPHNHAWYYSWLDLPQLDFLKSRALYQQYVYQQRIKTILLNINTYKPEIVLMYGMENINTLKQSVQEFLPGTKFKMIKATKRIIPQHHRAEIGNTILLITTQIPALRHNRIETGFDWLAFGKSINDPGAKQSKSF